MYEWAWTIWKWNVVFDRSHRTKVSGIVVNWKYWK